MIWKRIKEGVQNLDAYQKLDEEYQEKTVVGGTVSLLCWIWIFLLCMMRIQEFCEQNDTEETIFVDTTRSPKLRINLDVVFNSISCSYLSLDAMDSSGEQHLHIDDNVYKRRLDLNGNPLQELDPIKEHVGRTIIKNSKEEDNTTSETSVVKCGSCYGAENPIMNLTCCNTCADVREAYRHKKWHLNEESVEQCKSQPHVLQAMNAFKEGCHIYGFMDVNRVGGSFHIAPGQSFSINHVHVHDVQPFSSSSFNTSHYINEVSFSSVGSGGLPEKFSEKVNTNPLGGNQFIAKQGATMFNYYIKIVPTLVKSDNKTFQTYQFSVTKHEKVVTPSSGESGMPGVFFSYEISALMHQVTQKQEPWSHLVRDLLSIVGGVWILFRFIDHIFYESSKRLQQKMVLGKAG